MAEMVLGMDFLNGFKKRHWQMANSEWANESRTMANCLALGVVRGRNG